MARYGPEVLAPRTLDSRVRLSTAALGQPLVAAEPRCVSRRRQPLRGSDVIGPDQGTDFGPLDKSERGAGVVMAMPRLLAPSLADSKAADTARPARLPHLPADRSALELALDVHPARLAEEDARGGVLPRVIDWRQGRWVDRSSAPNRRLKPVATGTKPACAGWRSRVKGLRRCFFLGRGPEALATLLGSGLRRVRGRESAGAVNTRRFRVDSEPPRGTYPAPAERLPSAKNE